MTDSKQVPEIKQLPIAEQMERLGTWVRGHSKLFNKYRGGKLNGFGQYEFLQPNRAVSPTADLKCYNQLVGEVRVLRNALAVLHRDGCSTAAEALWDALLYSDRYKRPYQLPFENEELDELEPMVLLMFEPVKLFQIMKWYPSSWYQLDRLFGEDTHTVPTDESRTVAQMLPSLKKYWEKSEGLGVLPMVIFLKPLERTYLVHLEVCRNGLMYVSTDHQLLHCIPVTLALLD